MTPESISHHNIFIVYVSPCNSNLVIIIMHVENLIEHVVINLHVDSSTRTPLIFSMHTRKRLGSLEMRLFYDKYFYLLSALTNFSVIGKWSNSLTQPKSSPVTTAVPEWLRWAVFTSALSAFLGQIPITSSPSTLYQREERERERERGGGGEGYEI